jgi:hypothetical protein
MNNRSIILPVILLTLGIGTSPVLFAQSTGTPPTGMNNPSAPDNNMKATAPNSSFSGWMTDYSKAHQGRISRQAYMDEAGRRWDAADKNNQGLTSDDINRTYGYGSASGNNSMNKDNKGK